MIIHCDQRHTKDIDWLIRYPEIYRTCFDDGCGPANEFTSATLLNNNFWRVLGIWEKNKFVSVFIFQPWNLITFQVHVAVLPEYRGNRAFEYSIQVIGWIFSHTPCKKIVALIPENNIRAYALAKICSFDQEGLIKESFQVNGIRKNETLMGLTEGAFYASSSSRSNRSRRCNYSR